MDEFLVGPTGHHYRVSDNTFQSAYPSWLQSYEFALLAEGFNRTKARSRTNRSLSRW